MTTEKTTKSKLAAATAAITKTILGAGAEKPKTVLVAQAVSEIHVSPDEVIAAGTLITDKIASIAGLDDDDLITLELGGHVKLVEVYAMAVGATDAG